MDAIERRNQAGVFVIVGFLSLISVATYLWSEYYIYLSAYLWFGFIYGMCLQYGRFCFSSAFRDLDGDGDEHLPCRPVRVSCGHRRADLRGGHGLRRRLRVGVALQDRRRQRLRHAGGAV